jgi:hypothetical protein
MELEPLLIKVFGLHHGLEFTITDLSAGLVSCIIVVPIASLGRALIHCVQ